MSDLSKMAANLLTNVSTEPPPLPELPKVEEKKKGGRKKPELVEVPAGASFSEKRAALLKNHINAVAKAFGQGAFQMASEMSYREVSRLSTGVFSLDYATGGGLPIGRVSILSGDFSSCKTRVALAMVADAQKRSVMNGKYLWEEMSDDERIPFSCAYIDAEGCFQNSWAEGCGVDTTALHLSRPLNQEEAAEIMVSAVSCGAYDLIILDSLAQMVPEDEMEAAMDESSYGTAAAKKNNQMFRKIQSHLNKYQKGDDPSVKGILPTVIIINQLRDKIGKFTMGQKTRPGGVGQDFYASVIIELHPHAVEYFDEKEKTLPSKAHFSYKVSKNKVSPPRVQGNFIMAVANHPDGDYKAGEFLEMKTVWEQCEMLGLISRDKKDQWEFKGETFKLKRDLGEKWFLDKRNFAVVKREVLAVLCPKQ